MEAYLEAYLIRVAASARIFASRVLRATSRTEIIAGSISVITFSTAIAGRYSVVLPGKPNTKVKSFSCLSFIDTGRKYFGLYGTLSLEYSAGLLFLSA